MRAFIQGWFVEFNFVLAVAFFIAPSLVIPSSAHAQNIAISHCQGKCPQYASKLASTRATMVVHNLYAAGLNGDSGLADWVAYRLTKEAIGIASLLPRYWQPDNLVRFSGIEELADLDSSGVSLAEISSTGNPYGGVSTPAIDLEERARLAPMTSFAKTAYWSELNNLSNMVVMPMPLRRGAWLQLEQALNQLAIRKEELAVVSGPLFLISQPLSTLPSEAALNPAAYFKVVVGQTGIAAFVFPAELDQHERYCDQKGKLEQIERMSGLQLFPDRQVIESIELLTELGCSQ